MMFAIFLCRTAWQPGCSQEQYVDVQQRKACCILSLWVVHVVDTSSVARPCGFCVYPRKESLPLPTLSFVDIHQPVMKHKFRLLSCARNLFNVFIMQLE